MSADVTTIIVPFCFSANSLNWVTSGVDGVRALGGVRTGTGFGLEATGDVTLRLTSKCSSWEPKTQYRHRLKSAEIKMASQPRDENYFLDNSQLMAPSPLTQFRASSESARRHFVPHSKRRSHVKPLAPSCPICRHMAVPRYSCSDVILSNTNQQPTRNLLVKTCVDANTEAVDVSISLKATLSSNALADWRAAGSRMRISASSRRISGETVVGSSSNGGSLLPI